MGRISKALDKLRTKCTQEGTHPTGNSTADILECIAEHFEGGGGGFEKITFTVTVEGENPVVTSTHSPAQVNSMISLAKPCIAEIIGFQPYLPALPIYKVELIANSGVLVPSVFMLKEYYDGEGEVAGYLYKEVIVVDGSGWKIKGM